MYFLDSNVFIGYISPEDRLHNLSKRILESIQAKKLSAVASSVSIMETVYVLKKYKKTNKEINDAVHALLSIDNLKFLPITSDILSESSDIVMNYNLHLGDAIIATTAVRANSEAIISDDGDFDGISFIKRIKLSDVL